MCYKYAKIERIGDWGGTRWMYYCFLYLWQTGEMNTQVLKLKKQKETQLRLEIAGTLTWSTELTPEKKRVQ